MLCATGAAIVVSSPMPRALHTAAIVAAAARLPLTVELDLREWLPHVEFAWRDSEDARVAYEDMIAAGGEREPGSPAFRSWTERSMTVDVRVADHEERLVGPGAGGGTVRVGDTVCRPPDRAPAAMRLVLQHLEDVGFDGSPRLLGQDELGRWILTYISGDVALPHCPLVKDDHAAMGRFDETMSIV
jgi:hypothetical protein